LALVQIPSGKNQVKLGKNGGILGISKKMICHHIWLSHLTPAMVGGAFAVCSALGLTGGLSKGWMSNKN
jgi:hypothetical protein